MTAGRKKRQQLKRQIARVDKVRADMVARAKAKAKENLKRKADNRGSSLDGAAPFYSDQGETK